jgi:hypothetical protein
LGEVYKARDTRLDRTVAIKILLTTLASDPQFRERFDREARITSQLNHPHICTLYDVGEQDGTSFLVMQYLEGQRSDERCRERRTCCRINSEPGGNRTHNPQIKRTAGGCPLVSQLVCQRRRSHGRFHGHGNPLHAARKIGLESRLDLGCKCS